MRLDHLSYAAGPDGARATAGELGRLLGSEFESGITGRRDHEGRPVSRTALRRTC
jgi:hypothetical protein